MIMRLAVLSLALAAATLAGTGAQAWPRAFEEYPPPAGANGFSANGFSLKGFSSGSTTIKGAVLADGTPIVLR
jgi:hypothetical protein